MASKARGAFEDNIQDITRLLEYYKAAEALTKASTESVALPEGSDVVLRSAVVLLVTYWETYIEDIVSEGVSHLVTHVSDPDKLPKELKKIIAKELKQDQNDIAVWQLAGDGWRPLISSHLEKFKESRNRNFNTPKSIQTREFVRTALGIDDITKSWKITVDKTDSTSEMCCKMLDSIIEVRGKIAHRGKLSKPINKTSVSTLASIIKQIVGKTGGAINTHVKQITNVPLWES